MRTLCLSPFFWLPVAALCSRELVRFWREKMRVLGFVGSPLIFWLVIGSGFGDLRFFFPGTLVLTVMFSAVFSTMSLIEDRREGFLLSMLVSPAPRSSMVLGKTLGSATLAWVQGLIFLAFAPLAGIRLSPLALVEVAALMFLISVTLTLLGFLVAWQMDSAQAFHAIINLALMPLWMVSGSLFTMAKAHGWIKVVMVVNPMTYMVAALRRVMDPSAGAQTPELPLSLIVIGACAVILLVASAASAGRKSSRSFA